MLQQAIALHHRGQLAEAASLYRKILTQNPQDAEALHLLGVIEAQRRHPLAAIALIDRAIKIQPNNADFFCNRGNALQDLKRFDDALASYDRALSIKPDHAEALNNRGNVLREMKRFDAALASYARALASKPDYAAALNNRGATLQDLKRFDAALASYDRALAIKPDYDEALSNRGNALQALKRFDDALASYDRALAIKPDYAEALMNRGNALQELKRLDDALASYDRALAIKPACAEALNRRGELLRQLNRWEEAALDFEYALGIDGNLKNGVGHLLFVRMQCCDWRDLQALTNRVSAGVKEGKCVCDPFAFQAISQSPADLQACSQIFTDDVHPPGKTQLWRGHRGDHTRIRLGYVSGEFRQQATSFLAVGLFELHDRERFEIYAFDNGYDDHGPVRKRLNAAFHEFVDISRQSDEGAAKLIRQREIDIAINLNGFFGLARGGVFALRVAPIQVNYLGFPATLGADYMDYIVADRIVIPEAEQRHYNEKVVYLPDSYQANDSRRIIADRVFTGAECGLPEEGLVFCCFNNSYKITPEIFDIWMRLLNRVQGSVLWLLEDNNSAAKNLRLEAQARGIEPERLVFAKRMELSDHLARHRLADLFLDTLPCNAHTTASDALWAGLPVLTCVGKTFPGRVAASLLNAVGLPELITHSLDEYEALALELASNPQRLLSLRQKLATNRLTHPLFNTAFFTKHLEAAYVAMWKRHQAGLAAEHIYVPSGAEPARGPSFASPHSRAPGDGRSSQEQT